MITTNAALQRRVISVLVASSVFAGVGMATVIAVSTLVVTQLSASALVGGMALTAAVLGTAVAALILSRIAASSGRRPALGLGYGAGALGGCAAAVAISTGSPTALLACLVLIGAGTAASLAARFAATDLAEPHRRARALALVVWATTFGAVAGPNLAGPVQAIASLANLKPTTGPFLLCAMMFGLAAALSWWGLRPDPLVRARATGCGARTAGTVPTGADVRAALFASHPALLGTGGIALSHLVMVGLMSMTPVHMDRGGATLQLVGLVISLHVAGMYALSPLFGWLADHAGRLRVLVLAALLLISSAVFCPTIPGHRTVCWPPASYCSDWGGLRRWWHARRW